MKLGFRLLDDVNGVNSFFEVQRLEITSGNPSTLYFRLVQRNTVNNQPCDLRYVPATGATVSVKFANIDTNNVITRTATNPFPDDRSIWSIPLMTTDKIQFGTMEVTLTEGATIRKMQPFSELASSDTDSKRFYC